MPRYHGGKKQPVSDAEETRPGPREGNRLVQGAKERVLRLGDGGEKQRVEY